MMNVQTAPSCLVRNRAMYRPTNVPFCLAKIGNTGNSIAMGTEEKKGEECSKRPRAKSITQPQFLTWKRQKGWIPRSFFGLDILNITSTSRIIWMQMHQLGRLKQAGNVQKA
ncbi:uncharacterized protein LOC110813327 isoform X2 [Carica papaya]|uniref:uncharacterized protein LOC110813327 isoform X2 n=1 Tax=Carica papaya TaxID=3649 RepID=UPI000B8D0271|nr:uncharacterized protein LOC110813327 isoform X2 [Carica papaya]